MRVNPGLIHICETVLEFPLIWDLISDNVTLETLYKFSVIHPRLFILFCVYKSNFFFYFSIIILLAHCLNWAFKRGVFSRGVLQVWGILASARSAEHASALFWPVRSKHQYMTVSFDDGPLSHHCFVSCYLKKVLNLLNEHFLLGQVLIHVPCCIWMEITLSFTHINAYLLMFCQFYEYSLILCKI